MHTFLLVFLSVISLNAHGLHEDPCALMLATSLKSGVVQTLSVDRFAKVTAWNDSAQKSSPLEDGLFHAPPRFRMMGSTPDKLLIRPQGSRTFLVSKDSRGHLQLLFSNSLSYDIRLPGDITPNAVDLNFKPLREIESQIIGMSHLRQVDTPLRALSHKGTRQYLEMASAQAASSLYFAHHRKLYELRFHPCHLSQFENPQWENEVGSRAIQVPFQENKPGRIELKFTSTYRALPFLDFEQESETTGFLLNQGQYGDLVFVSLGPELGTIPLHPDLGEINFLKVFSPELALAASEVGKVILFDPKTGTILHDLAFPSLSWIGDLSAYVQSGDVYVWAINHADHGLYYWNSKMAFTLFKKDGTFPEQMIPKKIATDATPASVTQAGNSQQRGYFTNVEYSEGEVFYNRVLVMTERGEVMGLKHHASLSRIENDVYEWEKFKTNP